MTQTNGTKSVERYTASAAFIDTLYAAGIKYLFVNLGTDHPGLVEVFAHASMTKRKDFPRVITCPNEMVALSIAHSYAQITGECQAVLIHVETGTLALGGAIHNAAKARAPVLIWAGASPSTIEGEILGGRTEFIQFQQDVHDQRGIIRGYAKYTNEMRYGANVPQLTLRSLQIARSSPPGPVYLMGPREVMESTTEVDMARLRPMDRWKPLAPLPLPQSVLDTIVDALKSAKEPLIITSYLGKDQRSVPELVKLVEKTGAGVLDSVGGYVNFPTTHWGHVGSYNGGKNPDGLIESADVILVIESDVPWVPFHNKPKPDARVFLIDVDPLKEQMPMHYLFTEQSCRADSYEALRQLNAAMPKIDISERKKVLQAQHKARKEKEAKAETKVANEITMAYLTACVRDTIPEDESIIVNETTTNIKFVIDHLQRTRPGTLYNSPAAALGWSGGAAIAAKLAHPEKVVVSMVGDGSYLFSVPSTVHWIAKRYNTPFITIVINNRGWRAPQRSTLALYPKGMTSQVSGDDVHCSIDPPPDYAGIATAAGGALGIKVETSDEVKPAIEKALATVKQGQSVLLDVMLPKF